MKIYFFSLFDRAVSAYAPPWISRSRAEAIRTVADDVNKADSQLNRHASDYQLFEVGSFDDQTGLVESRLSPEFVILVSELRVDESGQMPPMLQKMREDRRTQKS